MSAVRSVIVVAGIGNGTGTGAATARVFAKAGYLVALVSRNPEHLKKVADEIKQAGGEAETFPVPSYSYKDTLANFQQIKKHTWPNAPKAEIRVALWNASSGTFKTFLNVTEEDLDASNGVNVNAPFAFSREAILAFQGNEIDEVGRGTLLFTGATASIRGNVFTSAFASGKFALRALSQSLAKNLANRTSTYVAHAIIDGGILTDLSLKRKEGDAQEQFKNNADVRLSADSIAQAYLYLTNQDRSSWTWELDLRPATRNGRQVAAAERKLPR